MQLGKAGKNDLKEMCELNDQVFTGTKETLRMRILDGAQHGALNRCTCRNGRVSILPDGQYQCTAAPKNVDWRHTDNR